MCVRSSGDSGRIRNGDGVCWDIPEGPGSWRCHSRVRCEGGLAFSRAPQHVLFYVFCFILTASGQRELGGAPGRLTWSLSAGLGCVTLSLLISLYYNAIVAWVLWYLLNSFQHPLPWSSCPPDLNRTGELGTACCGGLGTTERGMGCSVPSIRAAVDGGCSSQGEGWGTTEVPLQPCAWHGHQWHCCC